MVEERVERRGLVSSACEGEDDEGEEGDEELEEGRRGVIRVRVGLCKMKVR